MVLNLFTSLILSWVCVSLAIGIVLFIGSLGRDVSHDISNYD